MKKIMFFLLISSLGYSQSKFVFTDGYIRATVTFEDKDSTTTQNTEIENLTDNDIFIPNIDEKIAVYHYSIEGNLYSYNGIMNSLNGSPSLNGRVYLMKIEPRKAYKLKEAIIKKSNTTIKSWVFTFDYLNSGRKVILSNSLYSISTNKYIKLYKYLSAKCN